jgi:hypothetical protein
MPQRALSKGARNPRHHQDVPRPRPQPALIDAVNQICRQWTGKHQR